MGWSQLCDSSWSLRVTWSWYFTSKTQVISVEFLLFKLAKKRISLHVEGSLSFRSDYCWISSQWLDRLGHPMEILRWEVAVRRLLLVAHYHLEADQQQGGDEGWMLRPRERRWSCTICYSDPLGNEVVGVQIAQYSPCLKTISTNVEGKVSPLLHVHTKYLLWRRIMIIFCFPRKDA